MGAHIVRKRLSRRDCITPEGSPDNGLAAFHGGVIFVDTEAAGYGWFIDSTPWRNEEFGRRISRSERQALPGGAAFGHVDLLTVLTHEVGHALGHSHAAGRGEAHHVMNETLGLGTRRSPVPGESSNSGRAAREEFFWQLAIDPDHFRATRRVRFGAATGNWNDDVDDFFASGGFSG